MPYVESFGLCDCLYCPRIVFAPFVSELGVGILFRKSRRLEYINPVPLLLEVCKVGLDAISGLTRKLLEHLEEPAILVTRNICTKIDIQGIIDVKSPDSTTLLIRKLIYVQLFLISVPTSRVGSRNLKGQS